MPAPGAAADASLRIDRWLWAVRIFKTRALAAEACKAGHVRIAGSPVKSSRQVRVGLHIEVRTPGLVRRYEVLGLVDKRVGAKFVPAFLEEHTPPEAIERWREEQRERRQAERVADAEAGRPTKRERRRMEVFLKAVKK